MINPPPRRFGPKAHDHPSIGQDCPACRDPFKAGDYTALIALGPGGDLEAREKARTGRVYNAVAVEVHWACATGDEGHAGTGGA
jgi:hypothetical protein